MAFDTQYLLDTNILVHCVRDDDLWAEIRESYQLMLIEPIPLISIVTAAELRSLALQFEWGPEKLDRMEFALGYFIELPVDSRDLVNTYATLDAHLQRSGQKMGKNDLWIAATTILADAVLISTDRDFERLAPTYLRLERMEPVR
ncbi:MAG: type II toxin-antitoxin system VapC family toxin [Gemmataceae bacterium]|nr:type II toxin-antitoxin system VapC family toxin [Gemmataceae bacterium]